MRVQKVCKGRLTVYNAVVIVLVLRIALQINTRFTQDVVEFVDIRDICVEKLRICFKLIEGIVVVNRARLGN